MASPKSSRRGYNRPAAFVGLLAVLAGVVLFLMADAEDNRVAAPSLTNRTPSANPTASAVKVSFSTLLTVPLDPKTIMPVKGEFDLPHGLTFFGGSLYVSDWNTNRIYKVNPNNGGRTTFAEEVAGAHDMVLDEAGNLIVPLFKTDRLVRIDARSGEVTQIAAGLDGPNGIAKSPGGGWYVSNNNNGTVTLVSAEGVPTRIASGLKEPAGIAIAKNGRILVAQYGDPVNSVVQIADNGSVVPVVSSLTNAESLLYDGEGNLLIGHVVEGRGAISVFTANGVTKQVLQTALPGPFIGPVSDGQSLYFESAATGQRRVYRIPLP